jgi:hypothetical protein
MDKSWKVGIIKSRWFGLFSVPAPPFRFAASGGVFLLAMLDFTWQSENRRVRLWAGGPAAALDPDRPAASLADALRLPARGNCLLP